MFRILLKWVHSLERASPPSLRLPLALYKGEALLFLVPRSNYHPIPCMKFDAFVTENSLKYMLMRSLNYPQMRFVLLRKWICTFVGIYDENFSLHFLHPFWRLSKVRHGIRDELSAFLGDQVGGPNASAICSIWWLFRDVNSRAEELDLDKKLLILCWFMFFFIRGTTCVNDEDACSSCAYNG